MGRIKIKLKRCVYCDLDKPIFRNVPRKGPQCLDCYKREKMRTKNYKKNNREKKKKILETVQTQNLTNLVRTADNLLSIYVRRIFKLDNNLIPCYTCDRQLPFTDIQCGHFVSRRNFSTRWLADNCRPQCAHCNEVLHGNIEVFRQRLEAEFPGLADHLETVGKQVYSFSTSDLKDVIEDLKQKIRELK